MKRGLAWIALGATSVSFGAFSGCTCGSKGSATSGGTASASASTDAVAPSASATSSGPVDARSEARFSAPIAAAHLASGSVVAAALVASSKSIAVVSFGPAGAIDWTVDALVGVAWSSEVELRVLPAGDGVAVVWRGAVDGKFARYLVVVGPRGDVKGRAVEVGSALCATLDGLAWIDRAPGEPARVKMRGWGDGDAREILQLPAEPAPTLVCSDHRVHALVAGDDELSVTSVSVVGSTDGGSPAPIIISRDKDFPDDDDSDNQPFTVKDALGLVRVGESGALSMRELDDGALSPWRKLKHRLSTEDDVVAAVDGDASSLIIVYTHDQSELCKSPGATGKSLHALRIDRKSGDETRTLLAPADCGKEIGPFFIGAPERGFEVAWVERGKKSDTNSAPIRALLHRAIAVDAGAPSRVEQAADALVDAGCDASACWAVALVREPGSDGMLPEALRVIRYP